MASHQAALQLPQSGAAWQGCLLRSCWRMPEACQKQKAHTCDRLQNSLAKGRQAQGESYCALLPLACRARHCLFANGAQCYLQR